MSLSSLIRDPGENTSWSQPLDLFIYNLSAMTSVNVQPSPSLSKGQQLTAQQTNRWDTPTNYCVAAHPLEEEHSLASLAQSVLSKSLAE